MTRPPIPPEQLPHLRAAGEALRRARMAAGLTVDQVGARLGWGAATVIATEEGRKRTKRATFERYGQIIDPHGDLGARLIALAGPGLSDLQSRRDREGLSPEGRRAMRNLRRPDATPDEIDEAVAVITRGAPGATAERLAVSIRRVWEDVVAEAERVERPSHAPAPELSTVSAGQGGAHAPEATNDRSRYAT